MTMGNNNSFGWGCGFEHDLPTMSIFQLRTDRQTNRQAHKVMYRVATQLKMNNKKKHHHGGFFMILCDPNILCYIITSFIYYIMHIYCIVL